MLKNCCVPKRNGSKLKQNKVKQNNIWIPAGLILLALFLNLLGWLSEGFCDFYVHHIFPIWIATYGRVMGWFPFSVGELMLYAAAMIVAVLALSIPFYLMLRKKIPRKVKKCYAAFVKVVVWIFFVVCLIMTLNCFLLYHVSPLKESHPMFTEKEAREYGLEEVEILRNEIVLLSNYLAEQLERDAEGNLIYEKDMMIVRAKQAMASLGEEIPRLQGFYPDPKPLWKSDFFSQQYIMGYYFPFSLEANYNNMMCTGNYPATLCHELSHLKGVMREDEAGFIGYLACMEADDLFFNYSACLSVLTYVDNDFYRAIGENDAYYKSMPAISPLVKKDKQFLTEETWKKVEEDAMLSTETVKKASDTFTETTLTLNGVSEGKISYSKVVDLLLVYYDGILY